MNIMLHGISSMATRSVLSALTAEYLTSTGIEVRILSIGGVDAARRVGSGEVFDVVVLAADAIAGLAADQRVLPGSAVEFAASGVAVAVPSGVKPPAIDSDVAVREAVLAARRPSYSTGPSGAALMRLFERWGISEVIADRLVQARPGVPVGSLVAGGESDLGFQQLSEFLGVDGIDVVGPLPKEIQVTTVFSAAIGTGSANIDQAHAFLEFLASPQSADAKRRNGMEHVAQRR